VSIILYKILHFNKRTTIKQLLLWGTVKKAQRPPKRNWTLANRRKTKLPNRNRTSWSRTLRPQKPPNHGQDRTRMPTHQTPKRNRSPQGTKHRPGKLQRRFENNQSWFWSQVSPITWERSLGSPGNKRIEKLNQIIRWQKQGVVW